MGYILLVIAGVLIYVGLTRWIFRVNDSIRNQQIIIDMLGQILLRQGYSVDEVKTLIEKYKK